MVHSPSIPFNAKERELFQSGKQQREASLPAARWSVPAASPQECSERNGTVAQLLPLTSKAAPSGVRFTDTWVH